MSLRHPPRLKPDPELPGVFTGGWAAPREGPGPVGPQHPNNHPSPKKEPWVGPFWAHLLGETEAGRRGSPNPHDRAAQNTARFRVTQTDTLLLITSQLPCTKLRLFKAKADPDPRNIPRNDWVFPHFLPVHCIYSPSAHRQAKGKACTKSPLPCTRTHPLPAVIYIIYVPARHLRGTFTPWLCIYIYEATWGDEHGTEG